MVSVILPNYNHSKYLAQRIDSILAQSYQEFELIILDDRSPDESREVIERYRDNPHVSHIVYNEENSGSTFKQWDLGFSLAQGEYIWIAESDDYADPKFLERCVEELEQSPDATLCYCDSHIVDAEGYSLKDHFLQKYIEPTNGEGAILYDGREFIAERLLVQNMIYNASMVVFRKRLLAEIDPIYKRFRSCGDWLFWVMMANRGSVIRVAERLNYFRQHENKVSMSNSTHKMEALYIWLLSIFMLRRDSESMELITNRLNPQTLLYDDSAPSTIIALCRKLDRRGSQFLLSYIYRFVKSNREVLPTPLVNEYMQEIKRHHTIPLVDLMRRLSKGYYRHLKSYHYN